MAADASFLARWSRRKREEARKAAAPAAEKPVAPATSGAPSPARPPVPAPQPATESAGPPPLDLAEPDALQAVLAGDVPAELARAALRRAWHSDPAIRDFIGLSENSWDFTAPDGVPGFGLLRPEQLQRLLAPATGTSEADASQRATPAEFERAQPDPAADPRTVATPVPVTAAGTAGNPSADNSAVQQEFAESHEPAVHRSRHHGGALPK